MGLTDDFQKDRERNKQLYDNIVRWITKSPEKDLTDINIINIDRITEFQDVREKMRDHQTVIAWNGNTPRSEEFINQLTRWIKNGGAFVGGLTPWAWARKGRTVKQIPIYDLFKVM